MSCSRGGLPAIEHAPSPSREIACNDGGDHCHNSGGGDEIIQAQTTAQSKVPPEIWTNVFELVFRGAMRRDSSNTRIQVEEPWIISQVCREWRSIAHCTPSIWTIIVINSEDIRTSAEESCSTVSNSFRVKDLVRLTLHRLQLQLERSRTKPLEVTVCHHEWYSLAALADAKFESPFKILWSALYPHMYRSWSIDIRDSWPKNSVMRTFELTHSMCAMPPDVHYPFLRKLRWFSYRPSASGPVSFINAPNLRSLDICQGFLTARVRDCIPFAQITDIRFERVWASEGLEWSEVISLLKSMQTIHIRDINFSFLSAQQMLGPSCVLPTSLHSLSIDIEHSRDMKSFFLTELHSAPNLKSFTIDCGEFREWGPRPIALFLGRSSCSLTSFTIEGSVNLSTSANLESLLRLMPTLTHLDVGFHIAYQYTLNIVIYALARTRLDAAHHASPVFCPSLHTIRVGNAANAPTIFLYRPGLEALTSLVEARRPFGLAKLEVRNTISLDKDSDWSLARDQNAIEMLNLFGVKFQGG